MNRRFIVTWSRHATTWIRHLLGQAKLNMMQLPHVTQSSICMSFLTLSRECFLHASLTRNNFLHAVSFLTIQVWGVLLYHSRPQSTTTFTSGHCTLHHPVMLIMFEHMWQEVTGACCQVHNHPVLLFSVGAFLVSSELQSKSVSWNFIVPSIKLCSCTSLLTAGRLQQLLCIISDICWWPGTGFNILTGKSASHMNLPAYQSWSLKILFMCTGMKG